MKGKTRQRSDHKKTHSDNNQLRRQNSRLRKQIQRLNSLLSQFGRSQEEEEDIPLSPPISVSDGPLCAKCQKPVREMDLGIYVYFMCDSCGHREKKK